MAEKTLPPSYSDDKAGGASSSVVSRMSALRMIPCIDKDRKTAYISPKCVSLKDARTSILSKPHGKSPFLRVLINPEAVVGMIADKDDKQRTILSMEPFWSDVTHDTSVGILMPVGEVHERVVMALTRT